MLHYEFLNLQKYESNIKVAYMLSELTEVHTIWYPMINPMVKLYHSIEHFNVLYNNYT